MPEIGIFTNSYGKFGVRAAIEGAAKLGVKHVEVAMKPHDQGGLVVSKDVVVTVDTSLQDIDRLREWALGLNVSPTSANGSGNVTSDEGVASVIKRLDLAKRLGVRYYVMSVGTELDDTVIANLRRVGDHAATLGIRVGLETHPPLITNADVGLETMRRVDHKNVGINFDTANMYYYTEGIDAAAELERMIEHVVHVHLKDSRMGFKDWFFPAIGEGTIPLARMFATLNAAGYDGPYSLEIEGVEGEGEQSLEQLHDRIARSVEYLRREGLAS